MQILPDPRPASFTFRSVVSDVPAGQSAVTLPRFGTGVSVYALSQVGVPNSDVAIQKAWRFLIETQTENGSWIVNGTKKGTRDKPHPFSSFWGSTWALLGLSHSLPPAKPNENRALPGGS